MPGAGRGGTTGHPATVERRVLELNVGGGGGGGLRRAGDEDDVRRQDSVT